MKIKFPTLILGLTLSFFAYATPPQATPTPDHRPRLTGDWVKKDESIWETTISAFTKEWQLQAILHRGVLYLRQSVDCREGSKMQRTEIITQAKNILSLALVNCDGSTGFALTGYFVSSEFLGSMPVELRTWYNQSPDPKIVLPPAPQKQEPETSI